MEQGRAGEREREKEREEERAHLDDFAYVEFDVCREGDSHVILQLRDRERLRDRLHGLLGEVAHYEGGGEGGGGMFGEKEREI